jgi:uncharacterized protein (TIGR01777 family)
MRVTMTGATGRVGGAIVAALQARGDDVTVLSRDPERARAALGVEAAAWRPEDAPAPAEALAGRDGVIHLAGEDIAQRWTDDVKRRVMRSRELGTRNLVTGMRAADPRPPALISASAVGWYGRDRGDARLTEAEPAGQDFLAEVCEAWEREATAAEALGVRVAVIRTGIVLDKDGGALEKMLPPFKLGVGGPVAGGRQYLPWIHLDDLVALYLAALDGDWSGAFNGSAPEPVTNADFGKALGRVLHRPAVAPVPGFAIRLLYGEMADLVVYGQRAVPARPLELGFTFRHPDLDEALSSALAA